MAEQILFCTMSESLGKLGSLTVKEIGSANGVAGELTGLKSKLDILKGVLVDAEQKQVGSQMVQAWLRGLKDIVYDLDDLMDDFATHQLQRGVARQVGENSHNDSEQKGWIGTKMRARRSRMEKFQQSSVKARPCPKGPQPVLIKTPQTRAQKGRFQGSANRA